MENFLGEVVTKVLELFQDSHVRVRLAAFALMEMPINLVQAAQILYHHRFVHAFSIALGNEQDNKVKVRIGELLLIHLHRIKLLMCLRQLIFKLYLILIILCCFSRNKLPQLCYSF